MYLERENEQMKQDTGLKQDITQENVGWNKGNLPRVRREISEATRPLFNSMPDLSKLTGRLHHVAFNSASDHFTTGKIRREVSAAIEHEAPNLKGSDFQKLEDACVSAILKFDPNYQQPALELDLSQGATA